MCGDHSDHFGDHAIVCCSTGERIARHDHLKQYIFKAAQEVNLVPRNEERALIPGNNNKPTDVLIPA